jgi:putative ABC transport system permease protein
MHLLLRQPYRAHALRTLGRSRDRLAHTSADELVRPQVGGIRLLDNVPMWALLRTFSWQELRHHPWRNASALLAVMLGVALAYAVHLINTSALDEFAQAARTASGRGDLQIRAQQGAVDEAWFQRVAQQPGVAWAAPVLDVPSYLILSQGRQAIRVLGIDLLHVWTYAPTLAPQAWAGSSPTVALRAALGPGQVFLNPAAQALIQPTPVQADADKPQSLRLQTPSGLATVQVAGHLSASGPPLAVMDIAAAQELFEMLGQLSAIDVKLQAGQSEQSALAALRQRADWPVQLGISTVQDGQDQIGRLSLAYRVNLTVLAMIALFTGAFLVFSVLSLSVAKRAQQFALLAVLGLSRSQCLRLVLMESLVLGLVGSALGLMLGAGLAWLGLTRLGGDLGGGFFAGASPDLYLEPSALLLYGALGIGAAMLGGWWPARQAAQLPSAQTLKGLRAQEGQTVTSWFGLACLLSAALLSQGPPLGGMPLAAYGAVALLLLGGISLLPGLIGQILRWALPLGRHQTLALLALERARRQRNSAAVAVGSVVASLSLAVALTVMVASFRESVSHWLDQVLPADLYLRSARQASASDTVFFSSDFVRQAERVQGVRTLQAQRQLALHIDPRLPVLTLMARVLQNPDQDLPLVAPALVTPPGRVPVFVSEAVIDLYGLRPGHDWPALGQALGIQATAATFFIAGVWRDYARQSGAVVISGRHYASLRDDTRANDLAIWLEKPGDAQRVQDSLRALRNSEQPGSGDAMEFGTSAQIRETSLRIFDRSFAVTYWLQSVAIAIGLFGVAASFSAQVLARRKEFGLLKHLGLTRGQILTLVALEGAAWTGLGALAGLALGWLVALVLIDVVNPQSFHWTMDLMMPWNRLLTLLLAVLVCGTVTAWLAGRAAGTRDAVLAVKEDW